MLNFGAVNLFLVGLLQTRPFFKHECKKTSAIFFFLLFFGVWGPPSTKFTAGFLCFFSPPVFFKKKVSAMFPFYVSDLKSTALSNPKTEGA